MNWCSGSLVSMLSTGLLVDWGTAASDELQTSLQLTGQKNREVLIVYWYMWLLSFSAVGDQLRSIPKFNWPLVTAPHSLIGRSRHVSCGPGWGALGNIQWVSSYPSWARLQSESIVDLPPRWISSIVEYHPTVSS